MSAPTAIQTSDTQFQLCNTGLEKRSGESTERKCKGRVRLGECLICVYKYRLFVINKQLFAGINQHNVSSKSSDIGFILHFFGGI